jgi:cobalamin biosynthesis protein CobT
MKRICMTAMAASALAIAMPGVASAHGRSHHDARRAQSHHRRHHRSRTVTFAANVKTTTTTAPTSTKTEPIPGSGEVIGTVTSFEGGVLKITLADNSVVSGKVTEQTQISCATAQETGDDNGDNQSSSDDNQSSSDDNQSSSDSQSAGHGDSGGFSHVHGDDMSGNGNGNVGGDDGQDNQDDQQGEAAPCGTSALVPGAKVSEAELHIGGTGSIWEKVDLTQ